MSFGDRGLLALGIVLGLGLAPAAVRAQAAAAPARAPSSAPAAGTDSVKRALVQQLLVRTKAAELMMLGMEASIPAQRAADPRVPAVFWDRFVAEARASKGELLEAIGAIYDRHFSTAELRQLLAFYETPLGQKLLAEQPTITQESLAVGQEWGRQLGMKIGAQLAAEGLLPAP